MKRISQILRDIPKVSPAIRSTFSVAKVGPSSNSSKGSTATYVHAFNTALGL